MFGQVLLTALICDNEAKLVGKMHPLQLVGSSSHLMCVCVSVIVYVPYLTKKTALICIKVVLYTFDIILMFVNNPSDEIVFDVTNLPACKSH